ncbi:hypothetical protein [Companilactobacillus furfuricola]|uniref:hypothetical protein n=1 Tax=Companilactobacillus furfuricola TaxID=1462575 RepID=UPI0013DE48C3|nr:hypothetical protein [Companilactobacillus furfuricola]
MDWVMDAIFVFFLIGIIGVFVSLFFEIVLYGVIFTLAIIGLYLLVWVQKLL